MAIPKRKITEATMWLMPKAADQSVAAVDTRLWPRSRSIRWAYLGRHVLQVDAICDQGRLQGGSIHLRHLDSGRNRQRRRRPDSLTHDHAVGLHAHRGVCIVS